MSTTHFYLLISFFAFFFVSGCFPDTQNSSVMKKKSDTNQYKIIIKDTTLIIDSVLVEIIVPSGKTEGYILMLPGWNFSRTDCCNKSTFCKKATAAGFCLIMPEMGKSIYSGKFYKETRSEWKKYPSRVWVLESMIPLLQKNYGFLKDGGNNHLYGISTGARGVALLALHTKNIFKSGVALSGDYDQSLLKADNLMIGYYGTFSAFPDRWNGEDNALKNAQKIDIPLYLAHGRKDNIVPCSQTELFFEEMNKKNLKVKCEIHINEKAEHTYTFWDSETENALNFFQKNK